MTHATAQAHVDNPQSAQRTMAPLASGHAKNVARINQLGHRAHHVLGSWRRVADVWSMLFAAASTRSERESVRRGDVSDEDFSDAIAAVRLGSRAPEGPLASAIVNALLR